MSSPPDIADWVRNALPGVQAVYLFGSRAAGSSNAESDWDFEALALSDYARLNEERRDLLADVEARGRVYA
jgi:predicted nucleotidyltransferase